MKTIETLVFCDLETTGLPVDIGKKNVQITEFSFVSVNRCHFEDSDEDSIRILNKLSLCIQPRSTIAYSASKISGLCNILLQDEQRFDASTAELIIKFLQKLKPPVCLVAHNGEAFDFPLLAAELRRVNCSLSESILCVDSMLAIDHIFNNAMLPSKVPKLSSEKGNSSANENEIKIVFTRIKPPSANTSNASPATSVLSRPFSSSVLVQEKIDPRVTVIKTVPVTNCAPSTAAGNHVQNCHSNSAEPLREVSNNPVTSVASGSTNRSLLLDTLPKKPDLPKGRYVETEEDFDLLLNEDMDIMVMAAEMSEDSWVEKSIKTPTVKLPMNNPNPERTPDTSNSTIHLPDPVRKGVADKSIKNTTGANVRKKLEFGGMGIGQVSILKTGRNEKRSFHLGLTDVHKTLFGKGPAVAHNAEADTLSLMKICHKIKKEFLAFADGHSKDFRQIPPMW